MNRTISRTSSWLRAGRKLLTVALFATLTVGISSCEKEQEEATPASKAESPTMKRLLAMGFAPQAIRDKGDYYLVEGDIIFRKEAPVPIVPPKPGKPGVISKQQDQYHTTQLISHAKQPNITIRIDGSLFLNITMM